MTLEPDLQNSLISTAHAMADAARAASLRYFRATELTTENKDLAGFDPVTAADRETEAAMRAVLAEMRPDDGIQGEEEAATTGSSGFTWVIDPIDGTRGYISGTPTWGVLIAVKADAGPIFGIIDQPYIGERFEGGFGRAFVNGPMGESRLAVRKGRALAEATLFTTFPEVGTETERLGFEAVRDQVRLVRYGTDCYAYALLAAGHVDLVIEAGLHAYDIAAPVAVIEAAGGVITNWSGGPVHDGGRAIAAATHELHAEAMAFVQGASGIG